MSNTFVCHCIWKSTQTIIYDLVNETKCSESNKSCRTAGVIFLSAFKVRRYHHSNLCLSHASQPRSYHVQV